MCNVRRDNPPATFFRKIIQSNPIGRNSRIESLEGCLLANLLVDKWWLATGALFPGAGPSAGALSSASTVAWGTAAVFRGWQQIGVAQGLDQEVGNGMVEITRIDSQNAAY